MTCSMGFLWQIKPLPSFTTDLFQLLQAASMSVRVKLGGTLHFSSLLTALFRLMASRVATSPAFRLSAAHKKQPKGPSRECLVLGPSCSQRAFLAAVIARLGFIRVMVQHEVLATLPQDEDIDPLPLKLPDGNVLGVVRPSTPPLLVHFFYGYRDDETHSKQCFVQGLDV